MREAIVGVRPGLAHRPTHSVPGNQAGSNKIAEKKATEEAAQEYLNKLFTVRLVLPAHHEADLRQYIENLLTHPKPHELVARLGGLSVVRDVLDTIIHPAVRDPRHAIRLLNAFLADYGLAIRREQPGGTLAWIAPGEVTGHPLTLARLTVLRHDFRTLYDRIRNEHDLFDLLDDALLGSASALGDPLLSSFMVTKESDEDVPGTNADSDVTPRLDTEANPGLHYLRATAAKARPRRPAQLMPLLTLGSTPASRALGSQGAADVQRELQQRDSEAFQRRLEDIDMRERVLHGAVFALESARPGQDLDNILAATVYALSCMPDLAEHLEGEADATGRALSALTERIARQRNDAGTPIPSHHLIAILDLVPQAHLPSLYASLRQRPSPQPGNLPEAEQSAFTWAQAIIHLAPGEHARALRPALLTYFEELAETGTADQLNTWLIHYSESSITDRAVWPPHAFYALMGMGARAANKEATVEVRRVLEEGSPQHKWERPVIRGILTWLTTEDDTLRAQAIELLAGRDVPSDEWGSAVDPSAGSGATLATELVEHSAAFLVDDESPESAERTVGLLHGWLKILGDRTTTSGQQVSALLGNALAETAHSAPELASAAARILPDLQEQDAAACVVAIAQNLPAAQVDDETLGDALAETLLVFMRVSRNDPEAQEAATTALAALTASLALGDTRGAFARRHLAAVMSTDVGRESGAALIDQFMPSLGQHRAQLGPEVFASLHVLLRDANTCAARLQAVLQQLYHRVGTQPGPTTAFAAHYVADSAVATQWLVWLAQYWDSLPHHERTLALAAAPRTDVPQDLRALFVQHLLDANSPAVPWKFATHLWDTASSEHQAALLVAADNRCPDLSRHAEDASLDLLVDALSRTNSGSAPALLALMSSNPHAAEAISAYIDDSIAAREWDEAHVLKLTNGCPDPALLWNVLLAAAEKDQSSIQRISPLIGALIVAPSGGRPRDLVERLTHPLRDATPATAAALGSAVRSVPTVAKALRITLHGHSKTTADKERTASFKKAAGIR